MDASCCRTVLVAVGLLAVGTIRAWDDFDSGALDDVAVRPRPRRPRARDRSRCTARWHARRCPRARRRRCRREPLLTRGSVRAMASVYDRRADGRRLARRLVGARVRGRRRRLPRRRGADPPGRARGRQGPGRLVAARGRERPSSTGCRRRPLGRPPPPPSAPAHPNGVTALDHVVAITPDLDRTVAALEAAGLDLRRIREEPTPAGAPRQAFFRLGAPILEVVQEPAEAIERSGGADGPAFFWGLALVAPDLDATVAGLGRSAAARPRPAVQPGRRSPPCAARPASRCRWR